MEPRTYIINQINHIETHPVPYTIGFESEIAEKLSQYYKNGNWQDALNPYMTNVAFVDTIRLDNRGVDMFHAEWNIDSAVWKIINCPIKRASLEGYAFPSAGELIAPIMLNKESSTNQCKEETQRFKVIQMGWGIFERAWMLRGFEDFLMDCLCETPFAIELLEGITECYLEMVRACADIPADAFLFGDDWGDQRGIIMGAETWRKLIKPCWKRIYDEVHRQGKIVMSHSCGSIHDILEDLIEIGLDVYESVQPEPNNMNPYDLKKEFGNRITFWGCLGTQDVIPHGTPQQIRQEIEHLCTEMGKGGGYILAPAKPLQADTPLVNAIEIVEAFQSRNP